jgi:hypothetical protein
VWLKLVTVCCAYPAWIFVLYCIVTGQAKSLGALMAFSVFVVCALLHIIFDNRNRLTGQKEGGGLDLFGGE